MKIKASNILAFISGILAIIVGLRVPSMLEGLKNLPFEREIIDAVNNFFKTTFIVLGAITIVCGLFSRVGICRFFIVLVGIIEIIFGFTFISAILNFISSSRAKAEKIKFAQKALEDKEKQMEERIAQLEAEKAAASAEDSEGK